MTCPKSYGQFALTVHVSINRSWNVQKLLTKSENVILKNSAKVETFCFCNYRETRNKCRRLKEKLLKCKAEVEKRLNKWVINHGSSVVNSVIMCNRK